MTKNLDKESKFLFYKSNESKVRIKVVIGDETAWTTQKGMAEIFEVDRSVISKHLSNIFSEGELDKELVCAKIAHTAEDGKRYETQFYNLETIMSVGYRVNSLKALEFRKWATHILKEYLVKGFAMDDERLKQGKDMFGKDYFDELLQRVREIRASERRFYQKITDIYADCSIDYNAHSPITQEFFATVQNKLEYAITHHTAPELIRGRADAKKPHMGLTSWGNAPKGKVIKKDVSVAKNYLLEDELGELNIVVNMYLDYAELQAKKHRVMKMIDWVKKLDNFLQFNEYDILRDAGKVKSKVAKSFAEKEYSKFRVIQDREYKSDFDKMIENINEKGKLPESSEKAIDPFEGSGGMTEFNKNLDKALKYDPSKDRK